MPQRIKQKSEVYKLYGLPWYAFAIFSVAVLTAAYLGVLPTGMAGCFAFMIVIGAVLQEIGDKAPIVRSYLGGGAIVIIFGAALINYFGGFPETVVESIAGFFTPTGGFLDFYIAALITGSILGMNRGCLLSMVPVHNEKHDQRSSDGHWSLLS